jgi:hypothetical protein
MHGFMQKASAALLGLCMASAMANPHDPAFNAFMQLTVGNKTTVSFAGNGTPLVASSAPLGQPSIGQFGVSRTAQGVFMESIGGARVPGTNATIPVKGRIQLSGQVIGKTLAKAAIVYTLWEAGSALYDIWSDTGLSFDPQTGQVSLPSQGIVYEQGTGLPTWRVQAFGHLRNGSTPQNACANFGASIDGHMAAPPYNSTASWSTRFIPPSTCWVTANGVDHTITYPTKNADSTSCPIGTWHSPDFSSCLTSLPTQPLTQQQIADHIAQQSGWPDSRITHAIRDALRLPGVAPEIVPNLRIAPLEVTFPSGTPVVEVGEPETRTITRILPTGEVEEITRTTTRRGRTTTTEPSIKWEEETTTRRVVRAPDGTVISDEITEEETLPQTDQHITCGLPNTPACRINEEGTPSSPEDDGQTTFDWLIPNCLKSDWRNCFPELPNINWSFALPSRCSPIPVPFGQFGFTEVNICRWQGMIHDLMSMLWAAAGLFGAIGILSGRRNTEA